jgi:hypothetical protein
LIRSGARHRQDDDRQRPARDPEEREEPAPRTGVHQLLLGEKIAYDNFVNWNGYQPRLVSIDPETLIDKGVVPRQMGSAVVTEDMFKQDLTPVELLPSCDQMWLEAWTEITAGP